MNKLYLAVKKLLGFKMTYGELAEIAGDGPCKRCVGMSVGGVSVNQPAVNITDTPLHTNPRPNTGSGSQPPPKPK